MIAATADVAATEWLTISTSDGTASSVSDYTGRTNYGVTFLPGQTEQKFTIPIISDTLVESDETFNVTITQASQAISDGSFKIDAEVIADKLIGNAKELLTKFSS